MRVLPKDEIATYVKPDLPDATPVPAVKRQVVLIFRLRDGVTWHDGKPFTVEELYGSLWSRLDHDWERRG